MEASLTLKDLFRILGKGGVKNLQDWLEALNLSLFYNILCKIVLFRCREKCMLWYIYYLYTTMV